MSHLFYSVRRVHHCQYQLNQIIFCMCNVHTKSNRRRRSSRLSTPSLTRRVQHHNLSFCSYVDTLYGLNLSDKADIVWWLYTRCIVQQRPNICSECHGHGHGVLWHKAFMCKVGQSVSTSNNVINMHIKFQMTIDCHTEVFNTIYVNKTLWPSVCSRVIILLAQLQDITLLCEIFNCHLSDLQLALANCECRKHAGITRCMHTHVECFFCDIN